MSPQKRTTRVTDEVHAELERIERVVRDLREAVEGLDPHSSNVACLAVAACLHAFYTGCEAVLVRLVRSSGAMPSARDWHQVLLVVAAAPVEGVRPPIISAETATKLVELMRFRHFFRSSYGVELDAQRLGELAQVVPPLRDLFAADIATYLETLANTL